MILGCMILHAWSSILKSMCASMMIVAIGSLHSPALNFMHIQGPISKEDLPAGSTLTKRFPVRQKNKVRKPPWSTLQSPRMKA